jgi:hypothetical protein
MQTVRGTDMVNSARNILQLFVANVPHTVRWVMYLSIHYGNKVVSSSVSDVHRYVTNTKLLYSICLHISGIHTLVGNSTNRNFLSVRLRTQGMTYTSSQSMLCYDRLSVGQSVLVSSTHLGLTTRFLLLSDSCGFVNLGRPLWREYGSIVYNLHFRVRIPSGSWPSPNLEGQVPVFISPRNRVARLYPQALNSVFVASYDSQGYGGGIRTRLHSGIPWFVEQVGFMRPTSNR